MRLVFVYGPPGVGKLTVASELSALTGFTLFHNHLTVNLVTSIFPPNTEAWNRLARRIRLDVFAEAAQEGVDLILTQAPRATGPEEVARVGAMIERVLVAGGEVVFMHLACDREELLKRVQRDDRALHSKFTEPEILVGMYDLGATLPFEPHLRLDVTRLPPPGAAAQIAGHFALPLLPPQDRVAHDRYGYITSPTWL